MGNVANDWYTNGNFMDLAFSIQFMNQVEARSLHLKMDYPD